MSVENYFYMLTICMVNNAAKYSPETPILLPGTGTCFGFWKTMPKNPIKEVLVR